MKRIYIDFEMNMPNSKTKKELQKADIIAIGAVSYNDDTGEVDKFKSLIKPIFTTEIYPHIEELTKISSKDLEQAPKYEEVMRDFKKWLGLYTEIEGIYTFGNLDLTCLNNTDKFSAQKYNHPRFVNNIRDLFVDIKDKYLSYGLKCMNYISLKNLLTLSNMEFSGDAHDPLNDAYNLLILDKILESKEDIRNLLIIQDIIRAPFNELNENLEEKFEMYKNSFYNHDGEYDIYELSIEVIKAISQYIISLKEIDLYNIDSLRDINKKLDTIENIKNINTGYFYLLENLYYDMTDLLEDLMLYKLNNDEYIKEIDSIIELFYGDLRKDDIEIHEILEESC